jgi:magnesium chelatase family protein
MPHHSASKEGIVGGGRLLRPGEISLAHNGVLLLDEAPEFGMSLLQSLREPIEEAMVCIARAGASARFPAAFQLVMTFNPCPCGNLGREGHVCVCSAVEIHKYWRRLGGALLDRIDIRVPLLPVPPAEMGRPADPQETVEIAARVRRAAAIQRDRYAGREFSANSRLPAGLMETYCPLEQGGLVLLVKAAETLAISSRAYHSILRIARTIADLEASEPVTQAHLREAVEHRRYGDSDYCWARD